MIATDNLLSLDTKRYVILGLKDFDLSHAGSFIENHPVHQVLANLGVGSTVEICKYNDKIVVKKDNLNVAVLSKNALLTWQNQLQKIDSVCIIAMLTRYKTDSEEQYQSRCKVDQWEVPMIEVILRS